MAIDKKKFARNFGMAVILILALLGILRACYFSDSHQPKTYYLVARNISWHSFQISGKEPNMQAFAEELVTAAAKEAGLRIHFVPADKRSLMEGLEDDNYDAAFTFMVPDSLNEDTYLFSEPLYMLGLVLVVRNDTQVHSLQDMAGKLVALNGGSSTTSELSNYPSSMIVLTYENMNKALNDLANNKIDGVIMDSWHARINTQGFYAGKLHVATEPLTKQGLRLVTLNKEDEEAFIKKINDGLERVKASGLYKKLLRKWDLYDVEEMKD